MSYTEKATKYKKITESQSPGNVYEVQFKSDIDIDRFIEEQGGNVIEHLYSVNHDTTVYVQLSDLSVTKTVEGYLKSLQAKIVIKESGYNSDPRSLKRARES